MSKHEFEDISIPKWKLSIEGVAEGGARKVYRVFSSPTEFKTVEAASASEAVTKSGIEKVFMIKSGAKDDMTMLDSKMLSSASVSSTAIDPVAIPQTPEAPLAG